MLLTSAIPNLVNGVSQQPFNLRLSSQAEAQKNMLSSVVDGLSNRPGSRFLSRLTGTEEMFDDAYLHVINRDTQERYILFIKDGGLRVFDLSTGQEQTVNTPDGIAYLQNADPTVGFRAVTVADYTIIVNKNVVTAMDPALSPTRENIALVYIRGGNYGRTYSIRIDGVARFHTTPSGSDAENHPARIDTSDIARTLVERLEEDLSSDFTIERSRDVITIGRPDGQKFEITANDGAGNTNVAVFYEETQRFETLPDIAVDGFQLEITGDSNNGFGNYHVRFESDSSRAGSGVWKETLRGGEKFRLDAETMPHALIREADGTFTFRKLDWEDRKVGDSDSIPEPSFIGRPINDVFFYRNRLGFIADENVIMSRNAEFFNLFRRTATALTDADPIDVAVTHSRVSILNHAIPFNESLLLFSDQTQFIIENNDILTPTTVSIQQTSEFESIPETRPIGVGSFVYFPVNRGSFTGIREFFVDNQTAAKSANDVTSHCPRFIPSGVFKMSASTSEDMMTLLSRRERNKIWVYRYYINNQEKLQSSWSEWVLSKDARILEAEFIESQLVLVVSYPGQGGGVFLEIIDLESGAADENSDFLYRMDRKVYENEVALSFDGTHTTITLPYGAPGDLWVVTRPAPDDFSGDEVPAGEALIYERVDAETVKVLGDQTNTPLVIGSRIKGEYEFSTLTLRTSDQNGGQSSIGEGRLQIMYLALEFSRTGYFEVHVESRGRPTKIRRFTGNILGSASTVLGEISIQTGRFKVPVFSRNTETRIKIITDSFLPAYLMSAEWEGRYTTRARRA